MIAIYQGEGTSWQGEIPAKPITAKQILEGALHDFSLLIMPGGRDRPYMAALQGKANANIRSFVEKGGIYLGICAGAYYGCSEIEFDKGYPLEVCEGRELKFFRGKAIGPAYGKGTFEYNSEKGARLAKLQLDNGIAEVYYNGGCTFEGDFTNVRILASYLDLPNHPPAIIECPIGKGKAILSGVHLEKAAKPLLQEPVRQLNENADEKWFGQLSRHYSLKGDTHLQFPSLLQSLVPLS
jgi:glutamine amidotransferase-like uncharacterized protein